MDLKDKVAIVTGSTGGIGRSIALKLASQGAKVVVNGRSPEAGAAVVKAIEEAGGHAAFVQANVMERDQADELVRAAIRSFGQVDIMVASAGTQPSEGRVGRSGGWFAEIDIEAVAELVSRGTLIKLNPVRAVVDHMISRQSGSILFLTSEGRRVPTARQTALALHAGGLIMMTKVLAKELARSKICVNTVSVTLVQDTPAWDRYKDTGTENIMRSAFDKISSRAPYGLAKPENIADVAAFLVSDAAMFVTGATISATGGATFP